jgi:hypothetical protein
MSKADGFDDALLGVWWDDNGQRRLVYSFDKCVAILKRRDGCTSDEAVEHMCFNVVGSAQFPGAPIFIDRFEPA